MPERYDEKKLSEVVRKQRELEKERIEITNQIVKNLEQQKKIEREHLDLVEEHLKYWKKEIEKTNIIDTERLNELKDRIKMEERVHNKIKEQVMHIHEEIKIQKEIIQLIHNDEFIVTGRKMIPEKSESERILDQSKKKKNLEERFLDTHDKIIKTFKERKKFEKEYLDVIEKQKKYWNDRLKETDPQKDKERYNELKNKIRNEEKLIKQIKEELVRIDIELKQEEEHGKMGKVRKQRS